MRRLPPSRLMLPLVRCVRGIGQTCSPASPLLRAGRVIGHRLWSPRRSASGSSRNWRGGRRSSSDLPFDGLLSIVFGTAATFASLLLLHTRGLLGGIGPLSLAAGAVGWAGVFILAFWTLLRRWGVDPQLGHLMLGALSAAGLFLVGNHLLPLPAVVQWCSTRVGAGLGPLFFVVGTVYAAVPLLLFATSAARLRPPRPRRVLVAGGFFFMLVAPAIFLQCGYFTAGALLAWLLGAVAGSIFASAAGYWLGTRAGAQA